jgi:hypothetical protein
MRKSVYASPPRVSFLVSDLSRFGDPATRPPRGLPSPPTRGLPPRSRVPRASTQQPHQHTAGTEALFQSLPPSLFELRRTSRLPAQILSESQAAIAAGQSKPCPSRRRDRHPVLLGLALSACLRGIGSNGQFPFFVPPSRFYLHGSRSSRSFLTAIHLEPQRFYLFGRLEKNTQGLETGSDLP